MKSVENKAMLKNISMLNDRVAKSHKRVRQIFMSMRTIACPYYFLGNPVTLNKEPYKKDFRNLLREKLRS